MQLLGKPEIQKKLAEERKQAIDEGISLARKVDDLRKTANLESLQLRNFREGTTVEVLKELADLIQKRDQTLQEIREREEYRDMLLVPLQEREKQVENLEHQLVLRNDTLTQREQLVEGRDRRLDTREKEISLRQESILEQAQEIEKVAHTTLITKTNLEARERDLDDQLTRHQIEHNNKMMELAGREIQITNRETDVKNKEEVLESRRKELNAKERHITDLYQTYERNLKRNG